MLARLTGDPTNLYLPESATPEQRAEFAAANGFDKPWLTQLGDYFTVDHVFLDLHVWFPADARLTEAHRVSHVVKDRLMEKYPQIADAIIHIEPPPGEA